MDRSLYIAMSGAKQTMLAQTSNANNLANSQTPGFKADFAQFRSMPVFGPGQPTRVYAMTERPGIDFTPGSIQTTERDLDIAVNGEGWIAIQDEQGEEAYTRAGSLVITPQGLLTTNTGLPVLGDGGVITIPAAEKVDIGADGTISVVPFGEDAKTLVTIGRLKLVNPPLSDLEKRSDGLIHLKPEADEPVVDANITILQGAIEGSNVSGIGAMVDMIELAKNYELQVKVMKAVDDNSGVATKLMQIS